MKKRGIALIAITMLAVLGSTSPASAHDPSIYYSARWASYKSVPQLWAPSFPTGAWHDRVANARGAWNQTRASSGKAPFFYDAGQSTSEMDLGSCGYVTFSANQLHYMDTRPYNGTALALTWDCWYTDTREIVGFQIAVNNQYAWYTNTLTPGPAQYDLRSVVTHELGHAGGFMGDMMGNNAHWSDPSMCSPAVTAETMCPTIDPGTIWAQSLGTHDVHTWQAAYS